MRRQLRAPIVGLVVLLVTLTVLLGLSDLLPEQDSPGDSFFWSGGSPGCGGRDFTFINTPIDTGIELRVIGDVEDGWPFTVEGRLVEYPYGVWDQR
jgi:hypothetical protein